MIVRERGLDRLFRHLRDGTLQPPHRLALSHLEHTVFAESDPHHLEDESEKRKRIRRSRIKQKFFGEPLFEFDRTEFRRTLDDLPHPRAFHRPDGEFPELDAHQSRRALERFEIVGTHRAQHDERRPLRFNRIAKEREKARAGMVCLIVVAEEFLPLIDNEDRRRLRGGMKSAKVLCSGDQRIRLRIRRHGLGPLRGRSVEC